MTWRYQMCITSRNAWCDTPKLVDKMLSGLVAITSFMGSIYIPLKSSPNEALEVSSTSVPDAELLVQILLKETPPIQVWLNCAVRSPI